MADIVDLLEHAREVRPPALADLERVAHRRRRRAVVGATSALAAAVAALVVVTQPLATRDAAPAPIAPSPFPSRSPLPSREASTPPPDTIQGPFPTLTPEEVRNHPDAVRTERHAPVTAAPGVDARRWGVCLADCSRATQHQLGEFQEAIEVTVDDFRTSALYAAVGDESASHVIGDWFLYGTELVDGHGRTRDIGIGAPGPVTQLGGPLVHAREGVAWVDLDTMELHSIDGTYWDWWGASDTWYWGNVFRVPDTEVLEQGVVWQNPDGSFGVHMLPFDVTEWSTQMLVSRTPGTMGVIEPGPPRLLHVSTDYGATWDVRVVPDHWGTGTFVPADWRSWTEEWPSWPAA